MRWLVVLDDPDLVAPYRAEVEAETSGEALQEVANRAVRDTQKKEPARAGTAAVVGAAISAAFMMYGVAVRLDRVVDVTDEAE